MKAIRTLFLVFLAISCLPVVAFAQFGTGNSELQRNERYIKKLLGLRLSNQMISIDRNAWYQHAGWSEQECRNKGQAWLNQNKQTVKQAPNSVADPALQVGQLMALRKLLADFQGSMATRQSSVQDTRDGVNISFFSMRTFRCSAQLYYTSGRFNITLQEQVDPRHILTVNDMGPEGRLSIQIHMRNSQYRLDLIQEASGSVQILYINRPEGITQKNINSESYFKLMEDHGDFLSERVFPMLHGVGMALPLTVFDPIVIDAALSLSIDVPEDVQNEILKWIGKMNDFEFATRETATEKVADLFKQYSDVVVDMAHRDWPPETETRLGTIIEQIPQRKEAQRLAQKEKLARNLNYFLEVLPLVSKDRQKRVIRVLIQITGKEFQTAEEWTAWAATR